MHSDNRGEGALTLITNTTVIKFKKDTLIKVRESIIFTGDRSKFSTYKTSVGLYVWANNKRQIPNRILKIVPE
jgi:hypothetical protein